MKKLILPLLAIMMLLVAQPAFAGAQKTANALKETIAYVEKTYPNRSAEIEETLGKAKLVVKNYWKMDKPVVYKEAGIAYDNLIALTKDKKIKKPDWLH